MIDEFDFGAFLISIPTTSMTDYKLGRESCGYSILLYIEFLWQHFFSRRIPYKIKRMNDKSEKIQIRRASVTDAKLVSVLGTVTFYEAYFEQDDPSDIADYLYDSFNLDKIREELASPHAEFFIVYLNDYAVGYAKFRFDSRLDCVESENAVELQRIYLVERVFGKGVGEPLLEFCLESAREKGFESVWLGVWEQNPRAIRFYEKHGFVKVGTITFPYGETVGTNWVMEKIL
jgi:ribosomal protein S18 acetylase RimI-like enzyme